MCGKGVKIGLALGGGGARGLAHLGVWDKLEELGVDIACIAGTSIGAIVGAIIAAGRVDRALEWCGESDWRKFPKLMLETRPTMKALTSGRRVEKLLSELIGTDDFRKLEIPFAAVATDLNSGEEVAMREGDLLSAVRASMSIPGIFLPVEREGRVLVDGQLANPVPVSACRAMGADVVIAVDINPPGTGAAKPLAGFSIFDILVGTLNILNCRLTQNTFKEMRPDVLVRPPVGNVLALDFRRAEQLVEIGYDSVGDSIIDELSAAIRAVERNRAVTPPADAEALRDSPPDRRPTE